MRFLFPAFAMLLVTILACSARISDLPRGQGPTPGQPFGYTGEAEFERFFAVARELGVDLTGETDRIMEGDQAVLVRLFNLASHFETLDRDARTYGNILFSVFLNLTEARGPDVIPDALLLCSEDVRQRVRDFLYFPVTLVPEEHRAEVVEEVRADLRLFPSDYVFGNGNSLFE